MRAHKSSQATPTNARTASIKSNATDQFIKSFLASSFPTRKRVIIPLKAKRQRILGGATVNISEIFLDQQAFLHLSLMLLNSLHACIRNTHARLELCTPEAGRTGVRIITNDDGPCFWRLDMA